MTWEELHHVSGVIADVIIALAAIAAVIRFRILRPLAPRWRSELSCAAWRMPDGGVIFTADYILNNTGPRVLGLTNVTVRLVKSKVSGVVLEPDESHVLAERVMAASDPSLKGMFLVESGERSIFTLRCRLDEMPEAVFILCGFDLKRRRVPAAYRGFYCAAQMDQQAGIVPARHVPQSIASQAG